MSAGVYFADGPLKGVVRKYETLPAGVWQPVMSDAETNRLWVYEYEVKPTSFLSPKWPDVHIATQKMMWVARPGHGRDCSRSYFHLDFGPGRKELNQVTKKQDEQDITEFLMELDALAERYDVRWEEGSYEDSGVWFKGGTRATMDGSFYDW